MSSPDAPPSMASRKSCMGRQPSDRLARGSSRRSPSEVLLRAWSSNGGSSPSGSRPAPTSTADTPSGRTLRFRPRSRRWPLVAPGSGAAITGGTMTVATGVLVRPGAPAGRVVGAALAAVLVTASIGQAVRVLDQPRGAAAGGRPGRGGGDGVAGWAADGVGGQHRPVRPGGAVRRPGDGLRRVPHRHRGRGAPGRRGGPPRVRRAPPTVADAVDRAAAGGDGVVASPARIPPRGSRAPPTAEVVRYEEAWPGIDMTMRGTGSHAGVGPPRRRRRGPDRGGHDGGRRGPRSRWTATGPRCDGRQRAAPGDPGGVADRARRHPHRARRPRWDLDGDTLRVVPEGWDPDLPGVIDPTLEWSTYLGGGAGGRRRGQRPTPSRSTPAATPTSRATPTSDGLPHHGRGVRHRPSTGRQRRVRQQGWTPTAAPCSTAPCWAAPVTTSGQPASPSTATGNAYVTGSTPDATTDFPTTAGAYDTTLNGSNDVFVDQARPDRRVPCSTARCSAARARHRPATGDGIAVDGAGPPTSPGTRETHGLPDHRRRLRHDPRRRSSDVFVTKLDPTGSGARLQHPARRLEHATRAARIAVDGAGNAYVTGSTLDGATDYPTTAGRLRHHAQRHLGRLRHEARPRRQRPRLQHAARRLRQRLRPTASRSTPRADRRYVTGVTGERGNRPSSRPPRRLRHDPQRRHDVFVATLDATGTALLYSTLARRLGGRHRSGHRRGRHRPRLRHRRHARRGDRLPHHPRRLRHHARRHRRLRDQARPDRQRADLQHAARGRRAVDQAGGIASAPAGDVYLAGSTGSSVPGTNDFPTTAGAYDTTL